MSFYLRKTSELYSTIWYRDKKNNRITTGIKIPTRFWDKEKQIITRNHPNAKELNEKLRKFSPIIINSKKLLLPFFEEWATKGTATKITTRREDFYSYNVLKGFASPDTTFDDVNYSFYNDYIVYLQERGLSANSQGTHIRNLKAVMNEGFKRGLHTNLAFKAFKKPAEEVDSIYLTEEEVDRLRALNLSGYNEKVRDLFLVGCDTAMRFSDYSRICKDWFIDGEIHFISTKTSVRQSIPLPSEVEQIVQKYKGHVPQVNSVIFNRVIKELCRQAQINTPIQTVKTIGREKVVSIYEKWELVSSHTARRTAATLLVKKGAPIAWVMSLTGHKTENAFWKYIRLSKEDYSKLLKSFIQ